MSGSSEDERGGLGRAVGREEQDLQQELLWKGIRGELGKSKHLGLPAEPALGKEAMGSSRWS